MAKAWFEPSSKNPAPDTYSGSNFANVYDRPSGFVVLPKDFLPVTKTNLQVLASHFAKDSTTSSRDEMEAFMLQARAFVVKRMQNKIKFRFGKAVRDSKMKDDKGRQITTASELWSYWNRAKLTKETLSKFFNLIHVTFKKPGVADSILYDVHRDCGIWSEQTTGNQSPKGSNIRTILMNCI